MDSSAARRRETVPAIRASSWYAGTTTEKRAPAVRTCDTAAVGTASTGAAAVRTDEPTLVPTLACSCTRTRGQSRGPSAARTTLKFAAFRYQLAATSSHGRAPFGRPDRT